MTDSMTSIMFNYQLLFSIYLSIITDIFLSLLLTKYFLVNNSVKTNLKKKNTDVE